MSNDQKVELQLMDVRHKSLGRAPSSFTVVVE